MMNIPKNDDHSRKFFSFDGGISCSSVSSSESLAMMVTELSVSSSVLFGPPSGGPILFLLSPEVSGTSGTMSIYIIYMSTTWRTQSRYVIFRLHFSKIHSFALDFISEESFRPEEFFQVLL